MISRLAIGIVVVTFLCTGCKPPSPAANTPSAPSTGVSPAARGVTTSTNSSTSPTVQSAPPREDLSAVEPDIRLNAADLSQEVEADAQAAGAKYGGKVIQLEGEVLSVGENFVAMGQVTCWFGVPDAVLWQNLAQKSQATIKGRFQVREVGPSITRGQLSHSVLLAHGPSPRIVVTAEQLSAAARENLEEFLRTYDSQQLLLTGEVAAFEPARESKSDTVVFKTSGAPRVVLNPVRRIPERDAEIARFPVGKTVIIAASYYKLPNSKPNDEISLQLEHVALVPKEHGQGAKP